MTRERRKQETRQAIADAAMALFAAEGFDGVTIPRIAEAAGVSKMTVTNYFPRKEDLVFDQAEATIRDLADAVTRRRPGESLLAAVRRDYAERLAAGDVTLGPPTEAFARLVDGSHALTARAREILDLREQALARAVAAEAPPGDLRPRLVAAMLASVHRVLFRSSVDRMLAGEAPGEIRAALGPAAEAAFELLEPALGGDGYCAPMTVEERFERLVDELVTIDGVTPPAPGRGFGSSALKYRGRIFAMLVRGALVVKLPKARVTQLVTAGEGRHFDANKGTPMKEWFVLDEPSALSWSALAREALAHAGG